MISDETAPQRWFGSITLEDVAREASVHPSTVSRALDPTQPGRVKGSTRDRIIAAADKLGYRPDLVAKGLQSGRTSTIGVIAADLGNTFVTPLLHGISAAIETAEILSVIAESQDDHARLVNIVDHMLSRRVDGIVVVAARTGDQAVLESANQLVPVVLASRPLENTCLHQVTHDDERGGRLVAEHLIGLGHRQVSQLRGPRDVLNFPRRSEGFQSALEENEVKEVVVPEWADRPAYEDGRRLMELLLDTSTNLPSAVFAHNDLMALGALYVARTRGIRVPEDMSLVGFNDTPVVDHLTPPLTTIRYGSFEEGRQTGEMMVRLLAGEEPKNVVLKPSLVIRGSTRRV